MPRFFLDVLNGGEVREDPEGQDFADLDAALAEAVASARDLVARAIMQNEDVSGRSFLVRDENEQTVATVPFRDTLPGTLSSWPLPGADQLATLGTDLERLVEEHDRAFGKGERHLRDLIGALPAAIYMTDAEGRITFYNEAAVALAGRRPALGRDRWCVTWRLYQPDGTPLPHDQCPMAIALKENRPVRGTEAVAERPDGTRIPFMPFPTPLRDASGALVGGVNMLLGTTHRRGAEDRTGPH
jgi:PAS domain S-box-containing protein